MDNPSAYHGRAEIAPHAAASSADVQIGSSISTLAPLMKNLFDSLNVRKRQHILPDDLPLLVAFAGNYKHIPRL
jgi:hypothetical protein